VSALELRQAELRADVDLVPLSEVARTAPEGQEPAPGFHGSWRGEVYLVTAVLERTAVVEAADGERHVANQAALMVDPRTITWQAPALLPAALVHRSRRRRGAFAATRPATTGGGAQPPGEDRASRATAAPAPAPAPADMAPPSVSAPSAASDEDSAGRVPTADEAREAADVVEAANQPVAGAERRICERCDAELPGHNRRGLCVPCQRVCPGCGGPKSIVASRCLGCRRGGQEPATELTADEPSIADRALLELPARVQELLDQVVVLARYAHALEDEIDRSRAGMRELQRRIELFLEESER